MQNWTPSDIDTFAHKIGVIAHQHGLDVSLLHAASQRINLMVQGIDHDGFVHHLTQHGFSYDDHRGETRRTVDVDLMDGRIARLFLVSESTSK